MNPFKNPNFKSLAFVIGSLLLLNIIGHFLFLRIDLTKDKRFTLSPVTLKTIDAVQNTLSIKVYLQGDFPSEIKKLQQETKQLLEEYQAYNSHIVFEFVDPLEDEQDNPEAIKALYGKGIVPINVSVSHKGKESQTLAFPWAVAFYDNKEVAIPLLRNQMGTDITEKVLGSVQHLEYSFTEALDRLTKVKQKKVAVIKGNGELDERFIAKFLLQTKERYFIAPFTLDSVAQNPLGSLDALKQYDLAVMAKPTQTFTDAEKQVLDQFIMNGGKTLWLIDQVTVEMDSLYNPSGATLAFPKDLNLNDLFFKYGFRINPDIIKDEQGSPIKLASGEKGSATQFQEFNWKYAPLIRPISKHTIVKNLGGIKFDFANSIDTLKNGIKKTILLQSSPYSKKVGTPTEINLNIVTEEIPASAYIGKGNQNVAVLLEGNFHSNYQNRVLPFDQKDFLNRSKTTKMLVVADGDIIKNQLDKEFMPVELGYDQRTGNLYDNKDFLLNAVNYLLDDSGLINIRSKEFELPLLDKEKVFENYTQTQFLTIGMPLVLLLLFGLVFIYTRKRIYQK
jgi:gliding-associated putative ABC transporter substrate-binding component GldG